MNAQSDIIGIVVAEDDPDDRLLIEDAFKENCIPTQIQFVSDGEELLAYLRREGEWQSLRGQPYPSLILLDLNMPRMDGREALRHIKSDENLRTIPVVVLTTSRAEEDIVRTYCSGVNSFISKPVTFEGLVELVKTLVRYWLNTVQLPPECAK